jgi:hypothetical protein
VGKVAYVVSHQRATDTTVFGPIAGAGFDERAVDDQLPTALEEIEQACLAVGTVEDVVLVHRYPRHSAALCGKCVAGTHQPFLFDEHLPLRRLPLLRRHDRWRAHDSSPVLRLASFQGQPPETIFRTVLSGSKSSWMTVSLTWSP